MLIYYAVLLSCFISIFVKHKYIKLLILGCIALFLCGGYMCGTDWRSYEYAYNHSNLSTVHEESFEIGYSYLQAFFHSINVDFWIFHIFLKLLVFYSLCRFIHLSSANVFLFWFFFLPDMGFYLFIDCPFRNLLAMGGFCLTIKFLFERKMGIFFVMTFLLSLLHTSALFLIVIYGFCAIKEIRNNFYIVLFVLSNVLAYKLDLITDYILFPLLSIDGYWGDKIRTYFFDDDFWTSAVNIGTLYRIFSFGVILCFRDKIEKSSIYGHYFYNLTMLFFIVYPFGISMKMIQRFLFYLMPFLIVALEYVFSNMRKKMNLSHGILFGIFFMWGLLKVYTVTTDDFRYIPYSNYFEYVFESPSFTFRENYNIKNSPYEQK